MSSWCGSTRSFCREQETQGRRKCGESRPTGILGSIWEHGGGGRMGGRAFGRTEGLWEELVKR